MNRFAAGALVFFTSGAVLVLEILAARLLAPYVGVTLETYTAVIGTVLAGIATGTWLGGRLADVVHPRAMLGPLLVVGGGLSLASVPVVRVVGAAFAGRPEGVVALSVVGFFAPAAVLSAVTPTVVKLQLRDLAVTGRVVGRLSALGTAGAIVGTFLAGFVLVEAAATSTSLIVVGGLLVALGVVVWLRLARAGRRAAGVAVAIGVVAAVAGAGARGPCDAETVYHCARIVPDEERPGGRSLFLDTLRHSYVDLDDPTYLEFRYTKLFADVVAAAAPSGALDVLHLGGGGFTMPRYLRAVRPGSHSTVLEIDGALVDLARERLGLRAGPDLDVRVGDARLLVADLPARSQDVVLGDAFGALAVPWHLTTVEFARAVKAVLRPGGVYVMNLIDYREMRFARAETATLLRVFGHVAVLAPPALLGGEDGGNVVLVAGDEPVGAGALAARVAARGGRERVLTGESAAAFAGGAPVLTDDHAPVDQWLARARR